MDDRFEKCRRCGHYLEEHRRGAACVCWIIVVGGEYVCDCPAFVAVSDDRAARKEDW